MSVPKNHEIARLIRTNYQPKDIEDIILYLQRKGTFQFPVLDNGLFPAAIVAATTDYTGYSSVWVRDNVYVAYSYYEFNEKNVALKTINSLMQYFQIHKIRFENIIDSKVDPSCIMQRPHIRFNGGSLKEIDQPWEHAQNDALGYFLWFYCKLIIEKLLQPTLQEIAMLALFPLYFEAISYWRDEDSGHWEEARKIQASSIGTVVASLQALKEVMNIDPSFNEYFQYRNKLITIDSIDNLIQQGMSSLDSILPSECIQIGKERRYDSATLFLIYPLQILTDEMADKVISDVTEHLQGEHGISRYLDDSFWCRDYEDIPKSIRTSISTEREQWLERNGRSLQNGEEAQWCIFDPIISTIFGIKYQKTHQVEFLEKQTFYLNRSIGQLTANDFKMGGFKCPELYYLKGSSYVPNDATPLLWTQANFRVALKMMGKSLKTE